MLALLDGCSTPSSVPDAGVDAGAESFALQYAHTVCDSIGDCCAINGWKLDRASCMAVVAGEQQEQINRAVGRGESVHADRMAGCLAAARTTFRACPTTDWRAAQTRLLDACDVWSVAPAGSVPPGGACATYADCSSAGCDNASCSDVDAGRCTCGHLGMAGSPCNASSGSDYWFCNESDTYLSFRIFQGIAGTKGPATWSLYCPFPTDGGTVCTPVSAIGDPCNPGDAMGRTVQYCGGAACGATHTCEPFVSAGGACNLLETLRCDPASFCEVPSFLCVPKRGAGGSCGGSALYGGGECLSGFCDYPAKRCVTSPFAPLYVCGAI